MSPTFYNPAIMKGASEIPQDSTNYLCSRSVRVLRTSPMTLIGVMGNGLDAALSTDMGQTWQIQGNPGGSITGFKDLVATMDNFASRYIVAWIEAGVLKFSSTADGTTWDASVNVAIGPYSAINLPLTMDVSLTGTYIIGVSVIPSAATEEQIALARSVDKGRTWTKIILPPTNGNAADDSQVVISAGKSPNWMAVWRSAGQIGYANDGDIFSALSSDDGVTWPTFAAVNKNDTFGDGSPSLRFDGMDWMTTWTRTNGDNDILASQYSGGKWGGASELNQHAGTDTAMDSETESVITSMGETQWFVAWSSHYLGNGNTYSTDYAWYDGIQWNYGTNMTYQSGSQVRKILPFGTLFSLLRIRIDGIVVNLVYFHD